MTPETTKQQRRDGTGPERASARWALVFGLIAAAMFSLGSLDFCLDDAWIHLSYAKSLRLGEGPSYNPHDFELGFSSPLWMLLLSFTPIQASPLLWTKLLGALCHAGTALIASLFVIRLGAERAGLDDPKPLKSMGLLAGVLVAFQPDLVQGASSGMEVNLAAMLCAAASYAVLLRATPVAFLLGFAAALARPESVAFLGAFGVWSAASQRTPRPLAPAIGGTIAVGLWSLYCWTSFGVAWPNTKYAKAATLDLSGLSYVIETVLPRQPWLIALTGLYLIGRVLFKDQRRRTSPFNGALLAGWMVAILFVAVSRPLHVGVDFFEWRYFAPFAWIPYVIICVSVGDSRVRGLFALMAPICLATVILLATTHTRQRRQERNVANLHTTPSQWVARHLPARSTIAVEGAGALRFHTPRTMQIVDTLGLNDHEIIHAASDAARVCIIAARAPDFFVLPDPVVRNLARAFQFEEVKAFVEPDFAQVDRPYPLTVRVLRSHGLNDTWRTRCDDGTTPTR